MTKYNLIICLCLIGCSGAEFQTADQKISVPGPEAGMAGENAEAGQAGELNSAGSSSGGSSSVAGSSSGNGGEISGGTAGKDTGGTSTGGVSSGGTMAGSNMGGSISVAGSNTSGSGGNAGGTDSGPTCKHSMNGVACVGVTYTWEGVTTPAEYAWECPMVTEAPPDYLKQEDGKTVRQCADSKFGHPNNLWCCTSN